MAALRGPRLPPRAARARRGRGPGLDLEDVVVTPAGKRRMLRVVVDRDGGVEPRHRRRSEHRGLRTPSTSRDAMGGAPYVLEVTSPGVDRPLTEPRHWRRTARASSRVVDRGGDTR